MSAPAFEVSADGGSRGNPGDAAYGSVIAQDGRVVRELAGGLGKATNNVAEYHGLIAALEWVAEHAQDSEEVVVRLDSKLVVEQMSGRWKIKHPDMRELALRARDAYPPELVTYTWVPRNENKYADALVNEVLDGSDPYAVIDRAPV